MESGKWIKKPARRDTWAGEKYLQIFSSPLRNFRYGMEEEQGKDKEHDTSHDAKRYSKYPAVFQTESHREEDNYPQSNSSVTKTV